MRRICGSVAVALVLLRASTGIDFACHAAESSPPQLLSSRHAVEPKSCWFPFPRGTTATCLQGPFGTGTHREGYYWDFGLDEGTPVSAPANGRVIMVVDNHKLSGIRPKGNTPADVAEYQKISMENANQMAIDHGDGTYSFFWHHKAGTARVRAGEVVAAGAHLADVGMSGTYVPHICFSVHNLAATCEVRFHSGTNSLVSVDTGTRCRSGTLVTTNRPSSFVPSKIQGREFAANGVALQAGMPLFFLPSGREIVFEGTILEKAQAVGLYVWKAGQASEFVQTVMPDASGAFKLKARIPATSRGSRYYTIAITTPQGAVKYPTSAPVLIE